MQRLAHARKNNEVDDSSRRDASNVMQRHPDVKPKQSLKYDEEQLELQIQRSSDARQFTEAAIFKKQLDDLRATHLASTHLDSEVDLLEIELERLVDERNFM